MIRSCAGLIVLWCGPMFGQAPVFEVASIRTGAPFTMDLLRSGGVGMKIDAARVVIRSWSFADLIGAAYRVRTDQISGPDWMGSLRFDVQAKMPDGALPDQVPEMLQSLLAERFKLAVRSGQKTMPVYGLTVGKSGPKLQASTAAGSSPSGCIAVTGGHRLCRKMTMEDLANLLTQLSRMYAVMPPGGMTWGIDAPTVDLTGLTGAYDFTMDYGPGSEDTGGGPVMDAVERLGLRLEMQKRPYDIIIIDHLEKVPTEN